MNRTCYIYRLCVRLVMQFHYFLFIINCYSLFEKVVMISYLIIFVIFSPVAIQLSFFSLQEIIQVHLHHLPQMIFASQIRVRTMECAFDYQWGTIASVPQDILERCAQVVYSNYTILCEYMRNIIM